MFLALGPFRIQDDCRPLVSWRELLNTTLEKGREGAMVWLGFHPKSGAANKLWGCHLLGFTRASAHKFHAHIAEHPPARYMGIDSWFRRFVPAKILAQLPLQSCATQAQHVLKGRH